MAIFFEEYQKSSKNRANMCRSRHGGRPQESTKPMATRNRWHTEKNVLDWPGTQHQTAQRCRHASYAHMHLVNMLAGQLLDDDFSTYSRGVSILRAIPAGFKVLCEDS